MPATDFDEASVSHWSHKFTYNLTDTVAEWQLPMAEDTLVDVLQCLIFWEGNVLVADEEPMPFDVFSQTGA